MIGLPSLVILPEIITEVQANEGKALTINKMDIIINNNFRLIKIIS